MPGSPPKERATEAGQPFQYSGEPPAAPVSQWDATGLFPLGHRGYAGAVLPGYREFVFDKKYTCPNCRKEFKGLRTSAFKLTPVQSPGSRRYDLRAFYKDFQFEWFEVVSCPHCYFSALANPFADAKMLRKDRYAGALAEFRANVPLDCTAERDLDTVFAQHYLALICADGFMDALRHTAHLWMNLNWLYEDAGDEALRGYARDKAIEAYSAVYAQCRLNAVQEQRVCMALAGMLFGKGMWNEAREWAFKARINRAGKQNLADLAEQLIGDARAEIEARK